MMTMTEWAIEKERDISQTIAELMAGSGIAFVNGRNDVTLDQ